MPSTGYGPVRLDYGISNRAGEVQDQELDAILALARQLGWIPWTRPRPTARPRRGSGCTNTADFQLINKLAPGIQAVEIATSVAGSLQRLARTRLDGLLLHRSQDASPALFEQLAELQRQGRWARWGSPSTPPRSWHSGWRRGYPLSWCSSPPTCSISASCAQAGSTGCRLRGVRSTCAPSSCKACC